MPVFSGLSGKVVCHSIIKVRGGRARGADLG